MTTRPPQVHVPSELSRRIELFWVGVILLAGAGLRFYGLAIAPPGLWMDEALKARDAAATAAGEWRIVYPDVFPREPLFIWGQSIVIRLFGPDITAMRGLSALIGSLTVLALYFCVRRWSGPRVALFAAGILAGLRWHVIFSHLLFRTLLLPLWIILIMIAADSVRRRGGLRRAALLGGLIGGGFYTYLSWYFMLPGVLILAAWAIRGGREHQQGNQRSLGVRGFTVCAAMFLVFAPIGFHYLMNPALITARPGAVSVLNETHPAAAIMKNLRDALLMFNWRGDHVSKHNIPWAPALNPVIGLFFLAGVVSCLFRAVRREPAAMILLGWLALGIAPTVFTKTDSPNFLRTLVVVPAVCWIAALSMEKAWLFSSGRLFPGVINATILMLLVLSAILTFQQVFLRWARSEEVWQGFNGSFTQLGEAAAETPSGVTFWVPQYLGEHLTFGFLSGQSLPPGMRGAAAERIRPYADLSFLRPGEGEPPGARWIVATGHNQVYPLLLRYVPGGRVIREFRTPGGGVWAVLYEIPPGSLPSAEQVEKAGQGLQMDLRW